MMVLALLPPLAVRPSPFRQKHLTPAIGESGVRGGGEKVGEREGRGRERKKVGKSERGGKVGVRTRKIDKKYAY